MKKGYEESHHVHDGEIPCAEVVRRVYAFIDGQMDLSELEMVKEHIAICLPCRDVIQFEQKLIAMIKTKGGMSAEAAPPVSPNLMQKIRDVIGLAAKG